MTFSFDFVKMILIGLFVRKIDFREEFDFSEASIIKSRQKRETWKLVVFKIISKRGCKIENVLF